MIDIDHLSCSIDGTPILTDINLQLPRAQLTALIGPNGAGKSTLLAHLARLTPIQEGRITISGLDIAKTDTRELAKYIAIFQQNTTLMSRLTIDELLTIARFPYHRGWPKAADRAICEEMLDAFNLTDIRGRFLDSLSGGQRQRALCAMVFAQDTPVILLDEPLNNLDMRHARDLMQTLRRAVDQHSKTVVLVLHDINYTAKYADYTAALADGKIQFSGATADVLNADNISALYQIPIETLTHRGQTLCSYY